MLFHFSMKIMKAHRIAPRWDVTFCGVTSWSILFARMTGLYGLNDLKFHGMWQLSDVALLISPINNFASPMKFL